jgi:hypothetical protein
MDDKELAKYLRTVRAERKRLAAAVARMEAKNRVEVRFGGAEEAAAAIRALLLAELER